MKEPDFRRLPFRTNRDEWWVHVEVPDAATALNYIQGQGIGVVSVWMFKQSVDDFAREANLDEAEARIALGAGVLKYHRQSQLKDGQCLAVIFVGAPALELCIGRLGDFLLLHSIPTQGGTNDR